MEIEFKSGNQTKIELNKTLSKHGRNKNLKKPLLLYFFML